MDDGGLTRHSELAREKMWARIYLIPALQAEEDRDQVRRYLADKAREKELLGSETRVYNSDRCVVKAQPEWKHGGQTNDRLQIRPANLCGYPRERDEVESPRLRTDDVGRTQYVYKSMAKGTGHSSEWLAVAHRANATTTGSISTISQSPLCRKRDHATQRAHTLAAFGFSSRSARDVNVSYPLARRSYQGVICFEELAVEITSLFRRAS